MKTGKRLLSLTLFGVSLKRHRFMLLGIGAVVFLYIAVAGIVSVTTPWWSPQKNDTNRHVDYVWRLYNGDIPKYTDGVTYPPFIRKGYYSPQGAAANPPLFYVIHAPIVGPYLNAGKWEKGIAVGRIINMVLGVLCIFALAWAGWLYGGKRKELFAVAVPALSVLTYWFARLTRYYALDALVVLIATLNLIAIYKLLKHGFESKYLAAITFLSIAGMLTKATHVVLLFVSLVAIMAAGVINHKKIRPQSFVKGSLISAIIVSLVIISAGWFYYYWNYKTSGLWFRPFVTPDTSRDYRPLYSVLLSPDLWALFYARLAFIPVISTAITSFALAGWLTMKKISWAIVKKDKVLLWSVIALALVYLGTLGTQVVHGVGFGSINFRYILPAIFPISLFLAYGLLELKRARGQLVALAAIGMAGSTLLNIAVKTTADNLPSSIEGWPSGVERIITAASANGVPVGLTISLLVIFAIGAALLPVSMFYLSRKDKSVEAA